MNFEKVPGVSDVKKEPPRSAEASLAQKSLTNLANGKEIEWDYVAHHVKKGDITFDQAARALEAALLGLISKYQQSETIAATAKFKEPGAPAYWQERLAEAQDALNAIKKGSPAISFRGFTITKE